ncbi:MAG: UvrD-helicase domain-containing protein, partial [Actinomycetota bacterium]
MKRSAELLRDSVLGDSSGGTHQARFQRDVMVQSALERLDQLEIGNFALCFGRIDGDGGERFYIGRRAVTGPDQEPVVVDWRVPVAEGFYRATGRHRLNLILRRHFNCEGQRLTSIEDERFSDSGEELGLSGTGALVSALEAKRTGSMRDIVSTIQREQDEIIRAELDGVLVVQGGPGTGKTAVALHRAAYLLFTHRRVLERDGVLVVGPNRLFLRYIDRVLPALGESGVALTTPEGLFSGVKVTAVDVPTTARLKGDARMSQLIEHAVAKYE